MNLENGHGVSSVLERAAGCQSSRCRGVCSKIRMGCARPLVENLVIAARTTADSTIEDAVPVGRIKHSQALSSSAVTGTIA
jgi:hypothetical protein